MKRYDIERGPSDAWDAVGVEADDGTWVYACEALAVEEERDRLRARVAELEAEVERLKSPRTATVKPGWVLPEEPTCYACGSRRKPVALRDADGWVLAWSDWCSLCKTSLDDMDDIDWPFVEDYATPADFRALGFQVEVA